MWVKIKVVRKVMARSNEPKSAFIKRQKEGKRKNSERRTLFVKNDMSKLQVCLFLHQKCITKMVKNSKKMYFSKMKTVQVGR